MTDQLTVGNKKMVALTEAEIREGAPQVYTEKPASTVSKKYSFLPTFKLVADMLKLGWKVSKAQSMKSKSKTNNAYGKHLLCFFHPEIFIKGEDGKPEAYPQIVIMNNHRGWGRFKFEIGIFRLVCSNGLVIKTQDFGTFKMRHLGYSFEELQKLVNQAVEGLPKVVTKINKMDKTIMTQPQMKKFAEQALKVRLGVERAFTDEEIKQVLVSKRKEDDGNTVWKVFNRVQEHLMAGGFFIQPNEQKKARKVRKISNMLKDVEMNQRLWELVEETIK